MSAESNILQTLKALAAQYKPLIDAIPELENVVSLQNRASDAEGKLAQAEAKRQQAAQQFNEKVNSLNEAIVAKQRIHDNLVSNAQTKADDIIAVAYDKADKIAAEAVLKATSITNIAKEQAANTLKGIQDKTRELEELVRKTADAQAAYHLIRNALSKYTA